MSAHVSFSKILGSENFTGWLEREDTQRASEQDFSIPTTSECKKFKQI